MIIILLSQTPIHEKQALITKSGGYTIKLVKPIESLKFYNF